MASSNPSRKASNPSSTLLQDMLREKKAQTQRVNKTYDMNDSDDRGVQSSPVASMGTRGRQSSQPRHSSGAGNRNVSIPKEMNMKEMELHLSKINKQNFDLKLEVFHRRQRNDVLEAKVEEIDKLKTDNAEMQSINEDLLLELEKRDVAVQEAVGLICELEAKNEEMKAKIEEMGAAEMYFGHSRTLSTILASPRTSVGPEDLSTPPQVSRQTSVSTQDQQDKAGSEASKPRAGALSPDTANSSQRVPSFLRENKKSTHVLRSLYSSESLLSGDEEEDDMDGHIINSPRLSILSESGFSEIYGDTKDVKDCISPRQTDGTNDSEDPPARAASPPEIHREARLQKWIEARNRPTTPTRKSTHAAVNDRFSSIGELMEKVPSDTKGHPTTDELPQEQKVRQGRNSDKVERKGIRQHQRRPSSPAFGGPMFGGAMLPPTPGTMSSATIAGNSSTPSIVTEKSLLDGTPFPAEGYSALIPDGRPYSSDSNFAHFPSKALTFDGESDIESESPPNRSPKATRVLGAHTPIRPSLTTSATATVFSGEGYAATQLSRTLSYPSPTGRARRLSEQLSPTSEKSSVTVGDRASLLAQQDRRSGSSANTTPTKRGVRESQARSPPADQDPITPRVANPDAHQEVDAKLGRSASLRSKLNKMSLSPSQSTHQSVASRLFRRSNSQSIQVPSSAQTSAPSRPPIARDNSSTKHARLPRPSSLYGSSPIYGQRLTPSNISSPLRHREPQQISDTRPYELSPLLPEGMLTDVERSSSLRHARHERERR